MQKQLLGCTPGPVAAVAVVVAVAVAVAVVVVVAVAVVVACHNENMFGVYALVLFSCSRVNVCFHRLWFDFAGSH